VYAAVLQEHMPDWCRSVLGHDVPFNMLGRGGLPWLETEMLRIAHERGLEPPMPDWLTQWKAESDATRRTREEALAASARRDTEAWKAALDTCGLRPDKLEVRPNLRSAGQVRHGHRQAVNHVVPLIDVRSARRRHRAGRELCAISHARVLGGPGGEPATCKSCLAYTAEIRPDATEARS
jgi:hypothetical protein